jgi:hypothetical protein
MPYAVRGAGKAASERAGVGFINKTGVNAIGASQPIGVLRVRQEDC